MTQRVRAEDGAVVILADRLVDAVASEPLDDAALVVENGRIAAVGPRVAVTVPHNARVIEGENLTVMPGLVDAHVHLAGADGVDVLRDLMTRPTLRLLHAVPNCAATLRAGITTVRDAGGTPASVRDGIEDGLFLGPRVRVSITMLSETGGHADTFMPCGCEIPYGLGPDVPEGRVDGVDAVRARVREILRAGADWIKVCTGGGVLSALDDVDSAQFTVDEIRAAVTEAAAHGKRVMAHAISNAGIKNALRAGVASIEHGCLLDDEAIDMFLEHDAFLVPTVVAPINLLAIAERRPDAIPAASVDKARSLYERHRASVGAAIAAGVRIAMGTDSSIGPHGANARELCELVACGMSPLQAIRTATRSGAELLGLDDEIGRLEPGMVADLLVVQGDPLHDVGVIADPDNVRVVVARGRIVHADLA